MVRPLYQAVSQHQLSRGSNGHAGLWFDKFCDRWVPEEGSWTLPASASDQNAKLSWIRTLTDGDGAVGERAQIEQHTMRLVRLVERRGGRSGVFKTESRLVTGLGRSHPVENGFAWHPTLGTPYLPGSSIKGLVRAWAREHAEHSSDPDIMERLFGGPGRAASICFLDAVPTAPARLEADVMTPHYAGWSEEPPGDWLSPRPIPFLVTAAETPFLFGLIPTRTVTNADLDTVFDWQRDALLWAGGGAKTAVGYGCFCHDEQQTHKWKQRVADEDRQRRAEQERREAMRSPEGRWRLEIRERSEAEILDLVRIHLEKEPLDDRSERKAFIDAVLSTGLVQHWRRGKPRDPMTGVGKKKLKERARLLDAESDPVDSNSSE